MKFCVNCNFLIIFPLSLSVVVATTSQTGATVCGSRQQRTSVLFPIAAVKLQVNSVAAGTIPPTSTEWR